MSEDQKTQAAVDETKVPAEQGTEATSAQDGDDLDVLLKQFDDSKSGSSEPAKPEPKADAASETQAANDTILNEAKFIRQERIKKDIAETIKDIRGDLSSDFFDDSFVEAWLDSKAMKDPRLAKMWDERNASPQKFAQLKAALGKEFAKKYGRIPDAAATEDREAVTAAVRGASTKAPEGKAPDYGRMTDRELYKEWEKHGA